jgi:hypothetical protein
MRIAGPVGEAIGVPLTFVPACSVPVLLGVTAVNGCRLPQDEMAHPLDPTPGEAASVQPVRPG